jgi:hypothetical protein
LAAWEPWILGTAGEWVAGDLGNLIPGSLLELDHWSDDPPWHPGIKGNWRQRDQGAWVIDAAWSRGIQVIDGPWRLGLEWPRNQSGEGPRSLGFPFRLGPWSQWAWGPSCRAVQEPWSLEDQGIHGSSLQGISAAWGLGPGVPGDQGKSLTLRTWFPGTWGPREVVGVRTWFPGIVGPRDLGGKETTQRGTRVGPIRPVESLV